ncbi:MAG: membrane protein insertase YidC [Prolixibacteraceae bacterium]|nr:membrane protein insertase YidC [Prolixibacteraceae bacterium]
MDKNTTIGLVLIVAVLILFSVLNKPSKEQIEEAKRKKDSIELVNRQAQLEMEQQQRLDVGESNMPVALNEEDTATKTEGLKNLYGDFYMAAEGEEEFLTLENNLMRVVLSTKGGKIHSVELKNYKRYDSTDLFLIEAGEATHNLSFFAQNRNIQTEEFYFKPSVSDSKIMVNGPEIPKGKEGNVRFNKEEPGESRELVMRLETEGGNYIDYVYSISHNSYVIGYDIRTKGMEKLINTNTGYLNFNFDFKVPRQERASKYGEDRYTSIYYKFKGDEVDHLNLNKSDSDELKTPIKWIGFKQLFFSSVLIADDAFPNASVSSEKMEMDDPDVAFFKSEIGLPFDNQSSNEYGMSFYFGPNHYNTLKMVGNDMEKIISLGWPVVREVNRYLIIPVFNFLRSRIDNFGIIILILTILIRIIVTPFTYRSYVSQAKMKALKPEIDEINKKFPKEKAMERQQATMALYKKVGVSPLGGCLPMLFQMPILIAMFYFFPGSIELRQESFLWATDLSTYDSIISWKANIPILSSIYGNHISLFTLLMTITTIIQQKLLGQTQDTSSMPGMKYMMYFMPVFFMFILNSYSSGLSYYYLLSNIFTLGQTYIIRSTINEEKVRAQLLSNKKKPAKQKSGFQKRLEELAKQQEAAKKKKK